MKRLTISSRTSARLALVPWLSLAFLLTGCPLTDHYSLSDGLGGDANNDGGAGSDASGTGGSGGGTSGASSAAGGGGSSALQTGGNAGNSGTSSAGSGGTAGSVELGGSAGLGIAGAAEAGAPDTGGTAGQGPLGGSGGSVDSAGSGGVSGASGTGGASGSGGFAGSGGGPSCSALTCNALTCCATSGGCVDTTRDFQNCGSCGTLCNAGRSCMSSACTPGWVSMSAPPTGFVARWRAASVAIGKSVFIWGGSDSAGGVLDSGAIYSPMTDTWSPIAKDANTPTARVLATAVWTGNVVVVFGGSDASGTTPYKDGAIYDPAKNAWSAIPAASKARSAPLGFWDGYRAIFWGGLANPTTAVAGADRFDLTSWSASTVSGDPGAVLNPAAGWDGTSLYLEGGSVGGMRTDKVFAYTSSNIPDSWAMLSKKLTARTNAFGVWTASRFVVWGGIDQFSLKNDGQFLGPSPSTAWTTLSTAGAPSARMAVPRRSGWIFETSPGVLALFGGQTSTFGPGTFTNTGATYDVVAGKWGTVPAFPSGELHDYGVAVWTGDEFVLWGGRTGAALTPTLTGERWKP